MLEWWGGVISRAKGNFRFLKGCGWVVVKWRFAVKFKFIVNSGFLEFTVGVIERSINFKWNCGMSCVVRHQKLHRQSITEFDLMMSI